MLFDARGPAPMRRAEPVRHWPRSKTPAMTDLTPASPLFAWSSRCGRAQLRRVPSRHWPTNPTLRGGMGSGNVPASTKMSVSAITRPAAAVVPSGHWNELDLRTRKGRSVARGRSDERLAEVVEGHPGRHLANRVEHLAAGADGLDRLAADLVTGPDDSVGQRVRAGEHARADEVV